jgi:predicted enzyme related to lactoylglutathione lyase
MFRGLRSAIYHAPELAAAKAWYVRALDIEPYFDEPFYVGFNVGGFELGLNPDPAEKLKGLGGAVPYWGVTDADAAYRRLLGLGAKPVSPVSDMGGDIKIAVVEDPFGNALGIIENPHFQAGSAS